MARLEGQNKAKSRCSCGNCGWSLPLKRTALAVFEASSQRWCQYDARIRRDAGGYEIPANPDRDLARTESRGRREKEKSKASQVDEVGERNHFVRQLVE